METGKVTRYADNPLTKYVRSLDGEFYLIAEVADQVGRTVGTVHHAIKHHPEKRLGPTHQIQYGDMKVRLWTPERLDRLKKYFQELRGGEGEPRAKMGRRALWSLSESHDRQRSRDRAQYYKKKMNRLRRLGDEEGANEAYTIWKELDEKLIEERRKREIKIYGAARD